MSDLAALAEICRSAMCGPHQECDDQHPCSCRDAAKAIVAAGYSRPAPAPEGWKLQGHESEMFDGALNVAVELARSNSEQHRDLAKIIGGVCAIIQRRLLAAAPSPPQQKEKFQADLAEARAENERLRKALEEIVRVRDDEMCGVVGARLANIARKALNPEPRP